ncbi:radical SAM protein [Desulfohalobiaceae bacterium Ax17]|jgi:wyosine [tRNA(Phe)-imidazoG37] synthetase (radical SAM superfamily)|uniref:radical SAM protein n=1 Tax=Desulfovulcanus ferrireducens TaxID=2831190 RepID=UPI00207BA199|nr:radical SAM protein [Desulfovulcanus ferrireducens]MBT8764240.1 radical SAM protein [Desulfovulcanus ferrireducens]
MRFKYIFGPVLSSRLGKSLGVDLLGNKICNFDCLYCEVGKTEVHTTKRARYVPKEKIFTELKEWLELDLPEPDFITLGGQGEPCLNLELGEIIRGIKLIAPKIPVAVLTNGTLLGDAHVRKEISLADVVLPSLDTVVETEFKKLNRPCSGVSLKKIIAGLLTWRREFNGKVFLEILLIPGINDSLQNLEGLQKFCLQFKADRVDVVGMTRPGAYIKDCLLSKSAINKWQKVLGATTEPAQKIEGQKIKVRADEDIILASLTRRPQTKKDLALALSMGEEELSEILTRLENKGIVTKNYDSKNTKEFYTVDKR